jgi:methylated-DNA-protein-cysteine methyltransferase-like protein
MSPSYQRIRTVVSKIPRGRVMTYGDVALAAGMLGAARVVGYAMHSLGRSVPWQRVLGRRSARSGHLTIKDPQTRARQQQLLEKEGVRFSASGAIDLVTFGWMPRSKSSSTVARAKKRAKKRPSSRAKRG